jgi:hypothetical protein
VLDATGKRGAQQELKVIETARNKSLQISDLSLEQARLGETKLASMSRGIQEKNAGEVGAEYGALEDTKSPGRLRADRERLAGVEGVGINGAAAEKVPDFVDHSEDKNLEKFDYDLQTLEILGKSLEVDDLMLQQLSERDLHSKADKASLKINLEGLKKAGGIARENRSAYNSNRSNAKDK